MNTGKIAAMAKRGYSRDFTPKTERRVRIEVDRIPPTLYDAVIAKAKREGISLRALVLSLLKKWVENDG
jgi:predicted HicB family RNase H-like nuclease